MNELIDRLKSESPSFFKKLQWVIGILVFIFSTLQVLIANGIFSELQPYMTIITPVIAALAGAFGVSFLAKKDPEDKKQNVVGGGSRPDTRP